MNQSCRQKRLTLSRITSVAVGIVLAGGVLAATVPSDAQQSLGHAKALAPLSGPFASEAYIIYPAPTTWWAKDSAALASAGADTSFHVNGNKVTFKLVIPLPPGVPPQPVRIKSFPTGTRFYAVDGHLKDDVTGDDTDGGQPHDDGDSIIAVNTSGKVIANI